MHSPKVALICYSYPKWAMECVTCEVSNESNKVQQFGSSSQFSAIQGFSLEETRRGFVILRVVRNTQPASRQASERSDSLAIASDIPTCFHKINL